MSEENVEILHGVRTPVGASGEIRRRSVVERVYLRFPALGRVVLSAWSRLPPSSRLRRAFLSRTMSRGREAWNRRDWDVLVVFLDPEVEYETSTSALGGADLLGVHRGHEGCRQAWEAMIEAIEDLRVVHEEVIDFGDHLMTAGRGMGHGSSSGVPVDESLFQVYTLRHGLVIRQEDFADRDKALEAAGETAE
jgi:ketosteroid isomerase-like protein